MVKIRSRASRIKEYNENYPNRTDDIEAALRSHFRKRGWDLDKACAKARAKMDRIADMRKYETITITLYEYPMETARARVVNGHAYSPNAAENKKYLEKAVSEVLKDIRMVSTPAMLRVDAYMEMPSVVSPDEVILFEAKVLNPISRPDFDNLSKAYSDMLTGLFTIDDDIFCSAVINKYYSVIPRVELSISSLAANESDYIYKKLKSRKCVRDGIAAGRIELRRL